MSAITHSLYNFNGALAKAQEHDDIPYKQYM